MAAILLFELWTEAVHLPLGHDAFFDQHGSEAVLAGVTVGRELALRFKALLDLLGRRQTLFNDEPAQYCIEIVLGDFRHIAL
ncbi:MAG: hypothetical protein V3U29_00530 [Phycisphaeraceae bacterium]